MTPEKAFNSQICRSHLTVLYFMSPKATPSLFSKVGTVVEHLFEAFEHCFAALGLICATTEFHNGR